MSDPNLLAYTNAKLPPLWAAWLMRPVGWPTIGLAILCFLLLIWTARIPHSPDLPIVVIVSLLLVPWWSLRLVLCVVVNKIYRVPAAQTKWHRFAIPPALGLFSILLISGNLPQTVAWRLSKPALQRLAAKVTAQSASEPGTTPVKYPGGWAGLYPCEEVTFFPKSRSVLIVINANGLFGEHSGFGYFPDHSTQPAPYFEADAARGAFDPLEGDWYTMSRMR